MATPDQQLAVAVERRHQAGSLRRRVEQARVNATMSASALSEAQASLADEDHDVTRLESFSLTTILAHLKGSHATDLERETAERDAARYTALSAKARAEDDQAVVERLTAELTALGDVAGQYDAALAAKERWLRDHDQTANARLMDIADRRGRLRAEQTETTQAELVGEEALQHLRASAELLDSARSWSAYDTFFDGGMLASAIKQDKLDTVAHNLRTADGALRRLTTELADVHMRGIDALDMSPLMKTFDVWFDNFFTDWAVRDRIIDAQDKVTTAIASVREIVGRLHTRGSSIDGELKDLAYEREQLLQSA